MKITIEVTQDELGEMGFNKPVELEDFAIVGLESSCPPATIDLSPFNVYVNVVDEIVI
jgi:hypothetical protein